MNESKRDVPVTVAAVIAVLFGVLTVVSGGRTLFGGEATRQAAGAIVPFVLWFNFAAGLAYVFAGVGFWARRRWSVRLAAFIAVTTALVFAVFGIHVYSGAAYEMRTVGAMALRTLVWAVLAWIGYRRICCRQTCPGSVQGVTARRAHDARAAHDGNGSTTMNRKP